MSEEKIEDPVEVKEDAVTEEKAEATEEKTDATEQKAEATEETSDDDSNIEIEPESSEDVIEEKDEEEVAVKKKIEIDSSSWNPKTEAGRKVKSGEVTEIDELLENGVTILEEEIIENLMPDLETDLLMIGQAKGKFGGGQRRVFRQTQKKTREGNKPKFATCVVAGNKNGYVGLGYGKSKETVPAREKAIRNAKLNLIKIKRGCGSWSCHCGECHSIPFKVKGKVGSATIELLPAPKGTGLCVEPECAKILTYAGIKDCWSKTKGQTKTKINLLKACFLALMQLSETRVTEDVIEGLGIIAGKDPAFVPEVKEVEEEPKRRGRQIRQKRR